MKTQLILKNMEMDGKSYKTANAKIKVPLHVEATVDIQYEIDHNSQSMVARIVFIAGLRGCRVQNHNNSICSGSV